MSDSVRPHRRQPTRLPCPWDSPGKNTGVGCHFLLQCMKVKSESEVSQSCLTPSNPMDCSLPGSSIHGIFQARVLEWGTIACPWQSLIYFLTLWTFHINGIMQCVTLYLWLLSLRIMFSSLNHVTGHTIDHSFWWLNNIPQYDYVIFIKALNRTDA